MRPCFSNGYLKPLVCKGKDLQTVIKAWIELNNSSAKQLSEIIGGLHNRIKEIESGEADIVELTVADRILIACDCDEMHTYRNPHLSDEEFEEKMKEAGCDDDFIENIERIYTAP